MNNPLGIGWNGTSWYGYDSKDAGVSGMWEFLSFGTDGSMGRYMIPSTTPDTSSDELKYIYKAGFVDGNVPPGVLLLQDPNAMK